MHKSYTVADTARTTEPSYPDLQIHEDLTARVAARPLTMRDQPRAEDRDLDWSDDDDSLLGSIAR